MTLGARVDVFVSYRHGGETQDWVRDVLVPALREDGLVVVVDEDDFAPGGILTAEMERAAARSLVTLAVVDDSYRSSGFTTFEWRISSRLLSVVRGDVPAEHIPPSALPAIHLDDDDPVRVVAGVNSVLHRVLVLDADEDDDWTDGVLIPALHAAAVSARSVSDLDPGGFRLDAVERAFRSVDHVVVVLSDDYIRNLQLQPPSDLARTDLLIAQMESEMRTVKTLALGRDLRMGPDVPARYRSRNIINASAADRWRAAIEQLCAVLRVPAPTAGSRPACPYPGMRSFRDTEADATAFFGRDREIGDVLTKLGSGRFVAVVGPSGSGKSSLVLAGAVPQVRRHGLRDAVPFVVETVRPGGRPSSALEEAVGRLDRRWAEVCGGSGAQRHKLLVVDQFEECFTSADEAPTTDQDVATMLLTALGRDEELHVVITVRADFYDRLMGSDLWQLVAGAEVKVTPLRGEPLRDAIRRPAARENVVVQGELVERLAAETEDQPGLLPFLQEALVRLWENLEWNYLTLETYEDLFDTETGSIVRQAIARQADRALVEIERSVPGGERVVRRVLLRLIQFGQGTPHRRRQVTFAELVDVTPDRTAFDGVFEILQDRRILTVGTRDGAGDEHGDVVVVDLAHEAIIRGWPRLAGWIETDSALETDGRRWSARAREFEAGVGSPLTDPELSAAEEWLTSADESLGVGGGTRRFVTESRRRVDEERRREARRHRRWLMALGGFACFAIIAAAVLLVLVRQARQAQSAAEAEADRRVATQLRTSASATSGGLPLQSLLVRASDAIDPSDLSLLEMLVTAERDPPVALRIDATQRNVGFEAAVVLDDGRFVVGDGHGLLGFWDGDGTATGVDLSLDHAVLALAHEPGSRFVVAGGGNVSPSGDEFVGTDGWVDVVEVDASPRLVARVDLGSDQPVSAVLARGDRIFAGNWDGDVFEIDATDPAAPRLLRRLDRPLRPADGAGSCAIASSDRKVRSLAMDDERRWLVAGTNDCGLMVWDEPLAEAPRAIGGHTDKVRDVAFVPGAAELLSVGDDGTVRSTDLAAGVPRSEVLVDLTTDDGRAEGDPLARIITLCVESDAGGVVTAGRDHLVRRWRRGDGGLRSDGGVYSTHTSTVRSVTCLEDGTFLSVAGDGLVVWDPTRPARWGTTHAGLGTIDDVTVRPEGSGDVVVAAGGQVHLIRSDGTRRLVELSELRAELVAFDDRGDWLAISGARPGGHPDQVVLVDARSFEVRRRVDAVGVGEIHSLDVAAGPVVAAGMNDTGELMLVDGLDEAGRVVVVPTERRVGAIAIAEDGRVLAGDVGGTLMCRVPGGSYAEIELGREISDIDLHQESGTVAVGTRNGLVVSYPGALGAASHETCDPVRWQPLAPPIAHEAIHSVALAGGGTVLVAATSDATVELWDMPRLRSLGTLRLPDEATAEVVGISPRLAGASAQPRLVIGGGTTVVTYDVDRVRLRERLCDIAARELSTDERAAFLPGERHWEEASCDS